MSKRWVLNSRREDLLCKSPEYLNKNCVLCADHFEDCMFYNHTVKNSLLRIAIPTLFDVPHPPPQAGPKRPPPTPRENLPVIKKAKVNNIVMPANEL